ncbi:MAG: DUF86 domain-containing protein [Planctomycetes bacterium]|nr:DUF86 domain-containing protein [Planctomycetota bacterium]
MVYKPESVRERLKHLEEVIARLGAHRCTSLETYLKDGMLQWAIERGFILAAECVVDIAMHISSGAYQAHPPDQESAIQELGARGVISKATAAKLRGLGGFRNILVHQYLRVDPTQVHRHLVSGLEHLEVFLREVTLWLAKGTQQG